MHFGPEDDAGVSSQHTQPPAHGVAATVERLMKIAQTCGDLKELQDAITEALQAKAAAVEPVGEVLEGAAMAIMYDVLSPGTKLYTAHPLPAQVQEATENKYAIFWERLPGYLIDHHEGEELTEELLQRAAADLYAKFPELVATGLQPFGLLLLEERATTRRLLRELRDLTDAPTFMGEPRTPAPGMAEGVVEQPQGVTESLFDKLDWLFSKHTANFNNNRDNTEVRAEIEALLAKGRLGTGAVPASQELSK